MTEHGIADAAQIAGRLAEMRAEVRKYSARAENADIRAQLLETLAMLEQVMDLLAEQRLS